jgi:hypothetical protein
MKWLFGLYILGCLIFLSIILLAEKLSEDFKDFNVGTILVFILLWPVSIGVLVYLTITDRLKQ